MKAEARGDLNNEETVNSKIEEPSEDIEKTKVKTNAVFDFGFSDEGEERTVSGTRILNRKKVKKAISGGAAPLTTAKSIVQKQNDRVSEKKPKSTHGSDESRIRQRNRKLTNSKIRTSAGSSLKVVNIGKDKPESRNSKKTNLKLIVASVALLLSVGYFFKGEEKTNRPRGVASSDLEKIENQDQLVNFDKEELKKFGKIEFKNFDKFNQRAYLDGVMIDVDVLGYVNKVPYGSHYLRIEENGFENFVELVSINDRNKKLQVLIPKRKVLNLAILILAMIALKVRLSLIFLGRKELKRFPCKIKAILDFL